MKFSNFSRTLFTRVLITVLDVARRGETLNLVSMFHLGLIVKLIALCRLLYVLKCFVCMLHSVAKLRKLHITARRWTFVV